MRVWRGRCWMVQTARWMGPIHFGVYVSLRGPRYIDIHIPYFVLTIGCIDSVPYPPEYWASARDICMGVTFDNRHL